MMFLVVQVFHKVMIKKAYATFFSWMIGYQEDGLDKDWPKQNKLHEHMSKKKKIIKSFHGGAGGSGELPTFSCYISQIYYWLILALMETGLKIWNDDDVTSGQWKKAKNIRAKHIVNIFCAALNNRLRCRRQMT
jgi:hypothetical protein